MNVKSALSIFGLGTALLTGNAMAEPWTAHNHPEWAQNHPWRAHDNTRIVNQNRRINQELRKGEITRQQARADHQEVHAIRQEERADAAANGTSHLNAQQQQQINSQLNGTSSQIGQ